MSDRLNKLRVKFADLDDAYQAKLKALDDRVDAAGNPVPVSDAERADVEAQDKALQKLAKEVQDEAAAEERRASIAAISAKASSPAARDVTGTIKQVLVPAQPKVDLSVTQKFGIFVGGVLRRHFNPDRQLLKHVEEMGYEALANDWGGDQKALSTLTGAAGGFTVPTVLSTDFINWLYPKSAFLSGNPYNVDLSAGNVTFPGGNASATASYRAEVANIAYSDATLRTVTLAAKNLAAISAISNELIDRSPLMIDGWVQKDLQGAFTATMDLACLRGDGTSNTPIGIRNAISAGQRIAAAAGVAPSVDVVETGLRSIMILYASSNIPQGRPMWVMSPRVALYLKSQRTTNGPKAWPEMDSATPTLKGWPVIISTQVPSTLGAGTNESEIYLSDFDHVYFGDTKKLTVDVSREAAYDVSGTLNSAFSRNQTVIRLVGSHDVGVRYNAAVAVLTAVQWGA